MARDLSCPSGKTSYKTKREAVTDNPIGSAVARCDRCRWWHLAETRRRAGGARK